jgi:hypothetical protein
VNVFKDLDTLPPLGEGVLTSVNANIA